MPSTQPARYEPCPIWPRMLPRMEGPTLYFLLLYTTSPALAKHTLRGRSFCRIFCMLGHCVPCFSGILGCSPPLHPCVSTLLNPSSVLCHILGGTVWNHGLGSPSRSGMSLLGLCLRRAPQRGCGRSPGVPPPWDSHVLALPAAAFPLDLWRWILGTRLIHNPQ